jgi:tRNA A37 threonylcarbamoyladenosine dehydratase
MSNSNGDAAKSREDRLAEQLRANLRRRKAAARKSKGAGGTPANPEKDA